MRKIVLRKNERLTIGDLLPMGYEPFDGELHLDAEVRGGRLERVVPSVVLRMRQVRAMRVVSVDLDIKYNDGSPSFYRCGDLAAVSCTRLVADHTIEEAAHLVALDALERGLLTTFLAERIGYELRDCPVPLSHNDVLRVRADLSGAYSVRMLRTAWWTPSGENDGVASYAFAIPGGEAHIVHLHVARVTDSRVEVYHDEIPAGGASAADWHEKYGGCRPAILSGAVGAVARREVLA